jgi:hypothetical protein
MRHIPAQRQLEISEWVDNQLEGAAPPPELKQRPHDVDDYPHWESNPQSGITGTVYLARHTVYYYAADADKPPNTGWWDIGPLPENLREHDDDD